MDERMECSRNIKDEYRTADDDCLRRRLNSYHGSFPPLQSQLIYSKQSYCDLPFILALGKFKWLPNGRACRGDAGRYRRSVQVPNAGNWFVISICIRRQAQTDDWAASSFRTSQPPHPQASILILCLLVMCWKIVSHALLLLTDGWQSACLPPPIPWRSPASQRCRWLLLFG